MKSTHKRFQKEIFKKVCIELFEDALLSALMRKLCFCIAEWTVKVKVFEDNDNFSHVTHICIHVYIQTCLLFTLIMLLIIHFTSYNLHITNMTEYIYAIAIPRQNMMTVGF